MHKELDWPPEGIAEDRQLKLDKVRVPVELWLEGGVRLTGELFLLPVIEPSSERQRVIELLLADDRFVPLHSGGRVRLVNKERIVMLRAEDPADLGIEVGGVTDCREEGAVVELAGLPRASSSIMGRLRWISPPDRARLLDHVNEAGPWLAIERDGDPALVATRYVVTLDLAPERRGE
jgi:hypothetical protein